MFRGVVVEVLAARRTAAAERLGVGGFSPTRMVTVLR
jgi:hypothetical protein